MPCPGSFRKSNVKSDQAEPGKRLAEEEDYIGPALLGSHGVARGLRALGPIGTVRTTVVRDRRPFHLVTQADFPAIDRLLARFFREMGVRSTAAMLRDADRTTLRVRLDFATPVEERETAVSELFDQIEHLRFVLTEGRFNTADGLDVADGVATLSPVWLDQAERAREEKRVNRVRPDVERRLIAPTSLLAADAELIAVAHRSSVGHHDLNHLFALDVPPFLVGERGHDLPRARVDHFAGRRDTRTGRRG